MTCRDSIQPFFSVVVPAYNAQDTLRETLLSVFDQTYDDFELIIVDDGSTDQTGDIAEDLIYDQGRAVIIHQENGGSAAAINTGINQARGAFICVCSSDDQLLPNCLDDQRRTIETHPSFDLFCTSGYHFSHDGKWQRRMFKGQKWKNSKEITLPVLLEERFFGSGITFSREAALQVGGYTPGCYAEDFDFYLRLLLQGYRMWYSNRLCVKQRVSDFQKSANHEKLHESVLSIFQTTLRTDGLSGDNRQVLQDGLKRYESEYPATRKMIEQKATLDRRLSAIRNRTIRNIVSYFIQMTKPFVRPLRKLIARHSSGG